MNYYHDQSGMKMKVRIVLLVITIAGFPGLFSSCDNYVYTAPANVRPLSDKISEAIKLLTATVEGAGTGENVRGSKTILASSITIAQNVYDRNAKVGVLQADVDQAIVDLDAAVIKYNSSLVPTVDLPNLIGQWTLDNITDTNNGETVPDHSGNGRAGIIRAGNPFWGRGTPTFGTDRYGIFAKSLHFNGGANIEIPYNSDMNSPSLSISLWVKTDSTRLTNRNNKVAVSLNRSNGYQLAFDIVEKSVLTVNPQASPGSYITDNAATIAEAMWKHVAVTFGDGHMRFYSDGVLIKDAVQSGTIITQNPSVNLVFAQDLPTDLYSSNPVSPFYVNTGGYFSGYLDEIRVYKSVLTAEQVAKIYAIEKP